MKHSDSELLMLEALGLSSPGDQRRVRRLAEESEVAAHLLDLNRDLVARLTLASSTAMMVPPADLCRRIGMKITQDEVKVRSRARKVGLIALAGWIAAAVLAVYAIVYLGAGDKTRNQIAHIRSSPGAQENVGLGSSKQSLVLAASSDKDEKLQEVQAKLAKMQQTVQELQAQVYQPGSIRIRQFGSSRNSSADGAANGNTPIVEALAKVVQPMVIGGRISAADSEIVIERGFGAFDAETLPEGYMFRHRAFPVEQWKELGLYRDTAGRFYDPIGGLIWEPSAEDPSSYVSVMPNGQEDLSSFHPPNGADASLDKLAGSYNREASSPRVIAITDGASGKGKLVIGNADKLDSPVPGKVPMIWIGKKSGAGAVDWMRVGNLDFGDKLSGNNPPSGSGSANRSNSVAVFEINPQMSSWLNGNSEPLFGVSHQWPTVLPPSVPTEQVHTFGD